MGQIWSRKISSTHFHFWQDFVRLPPNPSWPGPAITKTCGGSEATGGASAIKAKRDFQDCAHTRAIPFVPHEDLKQRAWP
jgi:hypothetical protein